MNQAEVRRLIDVVELMSVRIGNSNGHMKAPSPQHTRLSQTENQHSQSFYQIIKPLRDATEPTRPNQGSWADIVIAEVPSIALLRREFAPKLKL